MRKENKLALKRQRAEQVNQAIQIIADHGRRFFYSQTVNRYASMEVDHRGKVWFIDYYSGKRVFTHETVWGGRWRGFTHGGMLKDVVKAFRDYICTGEPMHPGYLGPERSFDESNIWGYDDEGMKVVREQAGALPVFRQPVAVTA
ncbi:hypothetical protein SAMN04490185_3173 [Pseudomonas frederiksbergensis]|uniref:Uncharacterized protein n=1 Tax=Pseudomonas frederiksbergensis TaxID=104087 RepID=A0A1H4ZDP4_9PSED|nr:hypothetical protein [Pseudomonas frederiksbergensis]SED28282.1 hypothetical protein SAMN04490185_3173 [Pseudomonas frederiksbergensis]